MKQMEVNEMKEGMKMPGFTAEASLYKANKHFGMVSLSGAGTDGQNVQPQRVDVKVPWNAVAYSACFYGCWAGGGDGVECGNYCEGKYPF